MKNQLVQTAPAGQEIKKGSLFLKIAGFLMMLIGLMEAINGFQLVQLGRSFFYEAPVITDVGDINSAVIGIFTVSVLLFFCGLGVVLNRRFFWNLSFFAIIGYCAVEIINGKLLFGEILESQMAIPMTAAILLIMLLLIGRKEW